ncbi:MAG: YdeI/OmpD-associated family protein [Marmoricola sp.]
MTTFTTTLLRNGPNNVGIEVPEEIVLGFGAGKRVPVTVTLNGYSYSSTIAVMGGKYLIGVSAAHRAAAGVAGGEEHVVTIEHDSAPRTVEVPADLADALAEAGAREAFDALAYTFRKEHARSVLDAKKAETRERRIAKIVDQLTG